MKFQGTQDYVATDDLTIAVNAAVTLERVLRFTTEGVPGLPEILGAVAGRVPLLIEIKDQDGALGPDVGPLEMAVARDLETLKALPWAEGRTIVIPFYHPGGSPPKHYRFVVESARFRGVAIASALGGGYGEDQREVAARHARSMLTMAEANAAFEAPHSSTPAL